METEKQNYRILLLYRTFGPSVNLCGYLQLKRLEEDGLVQFRHMPMLRVRKADLNWANAVAFVRGDGLLDELIARACHQAGKYILYILDDDLFNVPLELGSGLYYAQNSVRRHIQRMLEYSDCFVSPSQRLIQKYGAVCGQSFQITEPSTFQRSEKRSSEDGVVRIGFAGSPDRQNDIDRILSQTLSEIKAKYKGRVSLEFFGIAPKIAEELGCNTYPHVTSYDEYQSLMARLDWDIGLAPMPETEFHACKHYNKLVEYCGFGIVGVYSDLPPYCGAVEDGVTGLVCENTKQAWVEAISRLIEDNELRMTMAKNCLARAAGLFSVETSARQMGEHLAQLELPADTEKVKGCLPWIKLRGVVSWYFEKVKKYGRKAPVVAVKKLVQLMKKR